MQETDDIDLILTLHPHGWSTCLIYINGEKFLLTISHVFGDPYIDFMQAITKLIKGHNTSYFFWYSEPGGQKIEIKKETERKNIISVSILGFQDSYEKEIKEFTQIVEFEVSFKNFLILSYLQLKKTYLLLKDKDYSKNRGNDFPFDEFIKFEQILKEYIPIDK